MQGTTDLKHLNYSRVIPEFKMGDKLRTPIFAKDQANDRMAVYEIVGIHYDHENNKTRLDLKEVTDV